MLEGIESALIAAGYDLTLYRLQPDATERRKVFEYFLVRKRVDAVIAVGIELTKHEVGLLHSLAKPVVGIGGPIEGIPTLSIDDVAAARLITNHLISLGHSRIMHFGGDQQREMDFHVHSQRLRGFREAMTAAGLDAGDSAFSATAMSIQGGYALGLAILADPRTRPTAVVAGSDELAIGTILAARQLGILVPSQLSVTGSTATTSLTCSGSRPSRSGPRRRGSTRSSSSWTSSETIPRGPSRAGSRIPCGLKCDAARLRRRLRLKAEMPAPRTGRAFPGERRKPT